MNPLESSIPQTYTVSSLTREIQENLQDNYHWVQVRGEISNLKPAASGHWYFSLKDPEALLSCVAWRTTTARWSGLKLKDGMAVIAGGAISVYPPRGQYQLVVSSLRLEGEGALQIRFEALKRKLFEEGFFDERHKKALPFFPKKIAVVTSPSGAALHDFMRVLFQSKCPAQVMICPVAVQGQDAAAQIGEMIAYLNQTQAADCIVVTRGGGSLEDLWPFNEEEAVRPVFDSSIPVISAVGHEIDFTLMDWVADHRAPTPTAAAEQLSRIYLVHVGRLYQGYDRLKRSIQPVLDQTQERLRSIESVLRRKHPLQITALHKQRLDEWQRRITRRMQERCTAEKRALQIQQSSLTRTISFAIQKQNERVAQFRRLLGSHDIQKTLARGFAICRDAENKILTQAESLQSGDSISIRLAKGSLTATTRTLSSS